MAENFFHSKHSTQEMEDVFDGAVLFNKEQELTTQEKLLVRQKIGAGESDSSYKVLGFFDTYQELVDYFETEIPAAGDAYGVSMASPYDVYIYDGVHNEWVDNGPIQYTPTLIDDEGISTGTTWSSEKIGAEIDEASASISEDLATKQDKIALSGILKGDGTDVSVATKGTDYGAFSFTVTLTAAGWSNNEQTVSNVNFLASGFAFIVAPNKAARTMYAKSGCYADDEVTVDGQITFYCDTVPTSDMTINITRMVSA